MQEQKLRGEIQEVLGDNSLVLVHNNKFIYSSKYAGLRPLFNCIIDNKQKFESQECTLYDKVIGLAAARLIVYSNIIGSIKTPLVSKRALELLEQENISIEYISLIDTILNKDKSGMCPMEERAIRITDNNEFFNEMNRIFSRE